MEQIRYGLQQGLDVTSYAKSEFDSWQMEQIRIGLKNELMHQIRYGLQQGLDVTIYAKSEFNWEQMEQMREIRLQLLKESTKK